MAEQGFVDLSKINKTMNKVDLEVDSGLGITRLHFAKTGDVSIEHITNAEPDLDFDPSSVFSKTPKITHVVITIPVSQDEQGHVYTVRNLVNANN